MDTISVDSREEEAPLLGEEKPTINHARDIHLLSCAFLFVFLAYSAAQNLESTLNTEQALGSTSMGILYLSFTLFSFVASPLVRLLGSKYALVVGTTGYWLFMAANLRPSWYTMVPASVYLGFAASLIWVGQGTYLTSAARSHAKDSNLHEGTILGNFNGEFWGFFASTQIIGNLVTLALLKNGKDDETVSGTTLLFTVFLGSMTLGTILMCFLRRRDSEGDLQKLSVSFSASVESLLKLVVAPLCDVTMLFIIPLFVYSGLQQAFMWAEFTKHVVKPALGEAGVGGAMTIYGVADAICSLVAGKYTSGLPSITLIVSGGAFLQMLVLFCLLLKHSLTSSILGYIFLVLMAFIWGMGNGVFNTQINAILGVLFRRDMEAAFAQLKAWQSGAIAVVFFIGPHIGFHTMLLSMLVALCISVAAFLVLTLQLEKAFSSAS